MKVAIYIFGLTTLASEVIFVFGQAIKSDFIDIGDNHEKIRKVFRESSIVNVLLKNYQQPEGVIKWLDGILGEGNASFVVFNIANSSYHEHFMKNCANFQSDISIRTAYHERVLKKVYSQTFYGFDSDLSLQMENNTAPDEKKFEEKFATFLDDWRRFKHAGYIVFTSLENLDTYIGCLTNRYGSFLFVIDEKFKNENYMKQVEEIFRKAWEKVRSFKIFVLIDRRVLTFNPFKRNDNTYGKMRDFKDLYTDEELKKMNGYPLYVEIFWSVFSITPTSKFESFKGPDIDATKMIIERMNTTCE